MFNIQNTHNIPEEMKNANRWVLWKYEEVNGKKKKVPINVYEKRIDFTNSNNWLTFQEATGICKNGEFDGIGFVLGGGFAGLDLDDCVESKLKQWAKGLLQILPPTYAEISPSGKGIKLFFKITGDGAAANKRSGSVEFYTHGRFFAVTGDKLRNAPNYLNEIDVASLIESLKTIVIAADIENGKYGEDLQELFCGNATGYRSSSEADLAFFNMLVKRCKIKSPEELEFIAKLSALKRDKWEEIHSSDGRTYLKMTIEKSLADSPPHDSPYSVHENMIVLWKKIEGVPVPQPLCNFTAGIREEVVIDDGAEQKLNFKIVGKLATGEPLPEIKVPADKFSNLNWVTSLWGSRAVVNAGNSAKDHLRAAIQMLSHPTRKNVFSHIGWRKLEGKWIFLHTGGGIGTDASVIVEPEADTLRRYVLPNDTSVDEKDAIKVALQFLEIAPLEMVVPIFAAIWRAPLNTILYAPLMLWVYGETGSYKSTITALALSFYGKFDKDSLPASWSATENYIERLAFLARDVLLVIDDFAPEFSRHSQEELARKVSRVVRNAGNRAHRGRMRSDLTLRPEFPPNALIISTAEQLPPSSMSLIGRTILVKFEKEKANLEKLTFMQEHAQILPYAMRAYLEWLAPQMDNFANVLPQRLVELRQRAAVEGHARLPENVAHLMLGIEIFSNFAVVVGALTPQEVNYLKEKSWEVLLNLAKEQALKMQDEKPTKQFITALQQLISSGQLILLHREFKHATDEDVLQRGTGVFAGWYDDNGLYLLPDVVWTAVSELLRADGGLGLGKSAIFDLLVKEGQVIPQGNRTTRVIRVDGMPKRVLHLKFNVFQNECDD
ncbi:DUF927 domain-containing protein [Thermoanaerobacter uzonensis]|uniref:phage NrS-1 polymerase family protein n=1 Tax=Thermoanaerobacter uzonensis TaxID=447593 RepID=UPI003D76963D